MTGTGRLQFIEGSMGVQTALFPSIYGLKKTRQELYHLAIVPV